MRARLLINKKKLALIAVLIIGRTAEARHSPDTIRGEIRQRNYIYQVWSLLRAKANIALTNLVYNMCRLV